MAIVARYGAEGTLFHPQRAVETSDPFLNRSYSCNVYPNATNLSSSNLGPQRLARFLDRPELRQLCNLPSQIGLADVPRSQRPRGAG